jgi:malonyl-CoA decarboxylase
MEKVKSSMSSLRFCIHRLWSAVHSPPIAGLQRQLAPLCAYYLLYAKQDQEPRDPAARFHLVNGARLARLNWLWDTSATGMRQSAGMMVNYVYRLAEVERNHETYARDRTVVASRRFELLARESLFARASAGQA